MMVVGGGLGGGGLFGEGLGGGGLFGEGLGGEGLRGGRGVWVVKV